MVDQRLVPDLNLCKVGTLIISHSDSILIIFAKVSVILRKYGPHFTNIYIGISSSELRQGLSFIHLHPGVRAVL